MPPKQYSKTPKNVSSQENNPSILNLGASEDQLLSSQVKSTTNFERTGNKKNSNEVVKISRNSSISSGLGGGSPRKRISPKKETNMPKSVIQERPIASPAKGWGELEGFSELKDRISQELVSNEEKSIEYQSEFPTLGEAVETPKGNTLPSLEILNPPTNVQTLLERNIDNSPSRKEKKGESLVSEEKIQEYESHFPSLGAELDEAKEAETKFDPEILEAEKKLAAGTKDVEPVNIVSFLEHEEPKEKTTHKRDLDKKTHGDLLSLDLELKSDNQEVMKKILDRNIHLAHTDLAPPLKDETWDKSVLNNQIKVETYVPKEKVHEYKTHFPALGAETEAAKPTETEFSRDILKAEEKFAVEVENIEPINIIAPQKEKSEERTREVTLTRSNEEQETKKQVRHIAPDDERLHIPIDEIPSEVMLEPEEVKTPRNSEADESEGLIFRIPLELVPDFIEDKLGMDYSPTHKRIKFLGYFNIYADQSPNIPQTEIEHLPRTFTEAFELFKFRELQSNLRISLESAPEFISEESMTPTNRRIKSLGQISAWGDKSPNASRAEIQKQPQTFGDAVRIVMASSVEDIEEKLASEIEQEEQVLDYIRRNKPIFHGEEQRIKQDKQLEEVQMSASLQESWDIIQGMDDEAEKKSYEGYKIVKPNIGDVEENQRLLSKQQDDFIKEEEDAEFGSYKAAGTKERTLIKDEKVEIQDETIRKALQQEPELESIEEKIVTEEKNEGINLRDELEKAEGKESPFNGSKGGEKSSLEHIAEEPTLAFTNQSADLTLSSQRIDLIKEELNAILNSPKNSLFKQVEKNFQNVKELEKSQMYGASINILKKSLDILDARIVKHEDFNIDQMNKYLIKINNELAHCYAQVQEFRESVGYARAALNLDSGNVKAIYYLGTGLNKIGDPLGGYDTLKDVRRLTPPTEEKEYFTLINIELEKFERKMEEGARKQLRLESPLVKEIPLTKLPSAYTPQAKKTPQKESSSSTLFNIGIFAGTAGVSGAASWFISKDYLNLSEKKSIMYSLGIGALVGGISLAIFW